MQSFEHLQAFIKQDPSALTIFYWLDENKAGERALLDSAILFPDADLVVFDPATVAACATYEAPLQRSVGYKYVIVNGVFVLKDGEMIVGALPWRPVRAHTARRDICGHHAWGDKHEIA